MGIPMVSDSDFVRPGTQRAIVANHEGKFFVWDAAPCLPIAPDQIFVKTDAIAINPSDTKMVGDFQTPFTVLGTDFAGTVLAIGSNIKDIAIGDRICGASHGMNELRPNRGAFSQYNVTNGRVWLKMPASMSSVSGASLCAGLCTAGLAIRSLGLPMPDTPVDKPFKVLVYGGSTATGTLVIQLLRLANLIPIATCSPKNSDMVEAYGAEEVFDYRQPDVAQKIRAYTKNNLAFALDCITTVESTTACYAAIGRGGGRYTALDPFSEHAATRKAIKADWVLGPSIFGEEITWPAPYARAGSPELVDFATTFYAVLQKLLNEGNLKNHPLHVMEGDLGTVLEGMELLKGGTISGEKIVVKLK